MRAVNIVCLTVGALFCLYILAVGFLAQSKAMADCQKTHSYETCVTQLR